MKEIRRKFSGGKTVGSWVINTSDTEIAEVIAAKLTHKQKFNRLSSLSGTIQYKKKRYKYCTVVKNCRQCDKTLSVYDFDEGTRICRHCNSRETRVCRKCNIEKPNSEFKLRGKYFDRTCLKCSNKGSRKILRDDIEAWCGHIVNVKKNLCKRESLPFDLDKKWYISKVKAGKCEATGIPFVIDTERRGYHIHGPTIDRINAGGGYTKDNCRVTISHFNIARGDKTDWEMFQMCFGFVFNSNPELLEKAMRETGIIRSKARRKSD